MRSVLREYFPAGKIIDASCKVKINGPVFYCRRGKIGDFQGCRIPGSPVTIKNIFYFYPVRSYFCSFCIDGKKGRTRDFSGCGSCKSEAYTASDRNVLIPHQILDRIHTGLVLDDRRIPNIRNLVRKVECKCPILYRLCSGVRDCYRAVKIASPLTVYREICL